MSKRPLSERNIVKVEPNPPKEETQEKKKRLKVAAYCRVSTDSKEQETSFDSQVKYYTELINKNPEWEFVGIYADPAISGTSRKHRTEFNKMLYNCLKGKINMIITKSMSRFARNQLDSLAVIRMLNGLHPPVRVLFEDDHINSDDLSADIIIVITSMLAEQESVKRSTSVIWGQKRRIEQGFYLVPTQNLIGYDKTKAIEKDDREIFIVEDEAVIVRVIYMMFLAGYHVSEIAYELTKAKVRTGRGNLIWNSGSVLGILKNERYAGDVRTNKSRIENIFTKKVIKNNGDFPYVYETDHHPAIVSHEVFNMTQKLIASHKYGYDPFVNGTYSLEIIEEGLLKGFIPINIHWAGSGLDEYIKIADTVEQTRDIFNGNQKVSYFPGFQVVRRQDVSHMSRVAMRITPSSIAFNRACVELLKSEYIEFLFNPIEKLVAVRASEIGLPGALLWVKKKNDKMEPGSIGCSAFTKIIYELMQWPKLWNTTLLGMSYSKGDESVLIFDLTQPEINALPYEKPKPKKESTDKNVFYNIEAMIAQQLELLHMKNSGNVILEEEEETDELPPPKRQKLHPREWAFSFGQDSADAAICCRRYQFESLNEWNIAAGSSRVADFDSSVEISENEIREQILQLKPAVDIMEE